MITIAELIALLRPIAEKNGYKMTSPIQTGMHDWHIQVYEANKAFATWDDIKHESPPPLGVRIGDENGEQFS